MGNFRTIIMIFAMIGPIIASSAVAQPIAQIASDAHSPWGDDSDVLAPAGAALPPASAQAPGPANPQQAIGAQSSPSPEDELRAVEEAQRNVSQTAPKEYELAPSPAPATPGPGMAMTPGVTANQPPLRSVPPPQSVRPPSMRSSSSGSRAPLPTYLYIRDSGEN